MFKFIPFVYNQRCHQCMILMHFMQFMSRLTLKFSSRQFLHIYALVTLKSVLRLLSSADNLCKQFGPYQDGHSVILHSSNQHSTFLIPGLDFLLHSFSSLIGIFSSTVETAIDLYSSTIESAVLLLLFLHLFIYLFIKYNIVLICIRRQS